jgi:fermentation-respiration switch protein FrsA (DUF1100 family)
MSPTAEAPRRSAIRSRRAGARERLVFRAAIACAAFAAIDDAFLHPEPGTGAGDHLVSALLPVSAALLLAVVYPRLGPGLRAGAALLCGVLAVTAGVADGLRHVLVDRPVGDDLSVMLAGVAGVALVALALLTLWRTRRHDERPLRRYARRAVVAFAAVVAGVFLVLPAAIAIVATHRAREPVVAAHLGRGYGPVTFVTSDGLRLNGWYVPSQNRAAVIVTPGRIGPIAHARMLARSGYGVLLFDRRGEGESDGDFNAYGWAGDADIKAAVTFLRGRADVDPARIGGLGLSVGGEMLLETAAEDRRLSAVATEGASVRSIAEEWHMPGIGRLRKPFTPMVAQTLSVSVLANRRPPPDLLELVGRIAPRPLLLIRGMDGQPSEILNRAFYEVAGAPKTLWEVPGAGHTQALAADPRGYERRVVGFFDRALLRRAR